MFNLLRKNKIKDFIPYLKDKNGVTASSHKENLNIAKDYYADIFSSPPLRGIDQTEARA